MTLTKKRLIIGLLTVAIFAAICGGISFYACAPAVSAYADTVALVGAGTDVNPYQIRTVYDLAAMSYLVNNDEEGLYKDKVYSVESGIALDISALEGASVLFSPIGTADKPFGGRFNGNGAVIYNLDFTDISDTCAAPSSYVGLFGYTTADARIYDIGVSGAVYSDNHARYVGGIVGYNCGTVERCFFEGKIVAERYAGGITGDNSGIIRRCFSNGTIVTSDHSAYSGGIAGYNRGQMSYGYTQAKVYSSNSGGAIAIGGVTGGISEYTNKPVYYYFNSTVNPTLNVIGASAVGEVTVDETDNMKGLTSDEINNTSVSTMFGIDAPNYWVRPGELMRNDHSGYSGPLLVEFDSFEDKVALASAVMVRMYGINRQSTEAWGSVSNPYLITNAEELDNLADAVSEYSESYLNKYFRMTADITASSAFSPIGNYNRNKWFGGTFDGGNHTIRGMHVATEDVYGSYLGMFGYASRATIRNLRLADDCTVTGGNNLGSLIGYANSVTVENVESRATINTLGNSGGIVGVIANDGTFRSILSAVKFVAPEGSSLSGFAGSSSASANTLIVNNAWYLAADVTDTSVSRSSGVAVMSVDTSCGTLSATKSDTGVITFNASPESGRSTQYRRDTEALVVDGNIFAAPNTNAYNNVIIYARFVKPIEVVVGGDGVAGDASFNFSEVNSTYYIGQKYQLGITLKDGFYIARVVNGTSEGKFSYQSLSSTIVYDDVTEADTNRLIVWLQKIAYDDSKFAHDHVYNGEAVIFEPGWLIVGDAPTGYHTDIVYFGGSAPVNASDREYSLTAVMYNAAGVRVGSSVIYYKISPATLIIADTSSLCKQKDWDNTNSPVNGQVALTKNVNGEVVLTNNVKVVIDGSTNVDVYSRDISNLIVNVSAAFAGSSIGESVAITYTFTLSGTSARNYKAPASLSGTGAIVKRLIEINPVSLTYVYDGTGAHFKAYDKIGQINQYPVNPSFEFEKVKREWDEDAEAYNYVEDDSRTDGDVGLYRVSISSISDSEHYRYSFYGKNGDADATLIFEILPRSVDVVYEADGISLDEATLVYKNSDFEIDAYFIDAQGNRVVLDYGVEFYKNDAWSTATQVRKAGDYKLQVADFVNSNYLLNNAESFAFTVGKAEQAALNAVVYKGIEKLAGDVTYGDDDITFGFEGGTVYNAGIEYALNEDSDLTGTGEIINDNEFVATKAGTFRVTVTLKGNDDYNDISATCDFTVNKAELYVSFAGNVSVAYYGEIAPEFTYQGLKYSETEPANLQGVILTISNDDFAEAINPYKHYAVGEYTLGLNVDRATSDGYELRLGTMRNVTLVVGKRDIVIKAIAASSEYGKADSVITFTVEGNIGITADMINGSLSREAGTAVADYAITLGNMNEEGINPDFNVSLYDGSDKALYSVTPAKLTLVVTEQTKKYGEHDPAVKFELIGLAFDDTVETIGLTADITRVSGEAAVSGSTVGMKYAYELRTGGSGITHNSSDYLADVEFVSAFITIVRGEPTFGDVDMLNLNAKSSLSTLGAPSVEFFAADGVTPVAGVCRWKDGTLVPDFSSESIINCVAEFIADNLNYNVVEFEVPVKVVPKEITVTFTGDSRVTYNGVDQPEMTYGFVGADSGDNLNATVTYSGERRNVGSYTVEVSIDNLNYKLVGKTSITVRIGKAPLKIAFTEETASFVDGDTIMLHYDYSGFVGEEDNSVLTTLPSYVAPAVPGVYVITPSGASADNYDIEYGSVTVTINRKILYAETSGTIFGGSFPPNLAAGLNKVDKDVDDIAEKYESLKSAYRVLSNKNIDSVWLINYYIDDKEYEHKDSITLSINMDEKYSDFSNVAFAAVTYDGDIILVQDVNYYGNMAVLKLKNVKYVIVTSSEFASLGGNSMYLYIGIGAGAVAVIVLVIVVASVRRKRRARIIKYYDDER